MKIVCSLNTHRVTDSSFLNTHGVTERAVPHLGLPNIQQHSEDGSSQCEGAKGVEEGVVVDASPVCGGFVDVHADQRCRYAWEKKK